MKKIHKTTLLLAALLTIGFTSCTDDDKAVTPDIPLVEFTFNQPEAGKMYGKGDTVYINGTLSWENELHGYEITLTNVSADSTVFSAHGHEDAHTIYIDKLWVNNVTAHSDMKLTINALTDHEGAKESKEIMFHCHPM